VEKKTPHCDLLRVKTLIDAGKVRATHTARATASLLGFDFKGMVAVVASLTMKDFCKSMTTYADHRIWQDVYRPQTSAGVIYVKLTVIDEVLIVSFKEL
jgi:motility quorum-sensing regulator / GCU-specific mRNA interferase toxin